MRIPTNSPSKYCYSIPRLGYRLLVAEGPSVHQKRLKPRSKPMILQILLDFQRCMRLSACFTITIYYGCRVCTIHRTRVLFMTQSHRLFLSRASPV